MDAGVPLTLPKEIFPRPGCREGSPREKEDWVVHPPDISAGFFKKNIVNNYDIVLQFFIIFITS
jgi:hypothetical protein